MTANAAYFDRHFADIGATKSTRDWPCNDLSGVKRSRQHDPATASPAANLNHRCDVHHEPVPTETG
jgi:hypothetical protein